MKTVHEKIFQPKNRHPSYEREIFPVLVVLRTWKRHLSVFQAILDLDNDAAKSALIRAVKPIELSQVVITEFVKLKRTPVSFLGSQGFLSPATRW